MSNTVEEIRAKIDEINKSLAECDSKIHGALQGAVDVIYSQWWIADFVKEYVQRKAQEGYQQWTTLPPRINPITEWALKETVDYLAVKNTGPQYCAVDFSAAAHAIGQGSLGPRGDDWDSGNTQNYRNAVQSLPTKLQNLQDAVREICNLFEDLKGDYDSFFIGLLLALVSAALAIAGIVVAIIGLVGALAGGAGIPVAVVGLVLCVLSGLAALAAFAILPDMDAARQTTASRLRDRATSVRNSPWPAKPALDSGGWR